MGRLTKRQLPEAGGQRVTICDRTHPHYGESGIFTGDVITFKLTREDMALVKLDACAHGMEACYVSKGQVRAL